MFSFSGLTFGNREIKGRALIDSAFCADLASVTVDDARNSRQPYARAFELLRLVETLENAE
jgi:hypothetical protein